MAFSKSGKWCSHHRSTSHDTSECRELKNDRGQPRKEAEMEKRDWRDQRWRGNDNRASKYHGNKWNDEKSYGGKGSKRFSGRNKRNNS